MKRLFVLCLLMVFMVSGVSYAATKSTAAMGDKVGDVVGIADLSSGDSVEVDHDGALLTHERGNEYVIASENDNALVSGALVVYGVVVKGVTAGDYIAFYDSLTYTGNPVLDVYVGTANDTKVVSLPAGMKFSTGLSSDATDADVIATVIYDN